MKRWAADLRAVVLSCSATGVRLDNAMKLTKSRGWSVAQSSDYVLVCALFTRGLRWSITSIPGSFIFQCGLKSAANICDLIFVNQITATDEFFE